MTTIEKETDRATLKGYVDKYLDALALNDPSGLPLAESVRFAENHRELAIGDGTWKTITGLGSYRHHFVDTKTNQAAAITVVEENGLKIIFALRLRISCGKISEIETLVIRDPFGAEKYENTQELPSLFLEIVPQELRKPRERLIELANMYFSGIENNDPNGDYSFFADNCDRFEHALRTSNNDPAAYGHSTDKVFVTLTCREQFETGFLGFVTRIRDRRFFIVDEECQVVIAFVFFDHNGTVRKIDMPDNRSFNIPPFFSTPRTLGLCEAFKIENDKLRQIEMTLTEFPYGTRPLWDREKDQWLRVSETRQPADRQPDKTRNELEGYLNQFLDALLTRKPESLGPEESIRYTENGQLLNPGDGLWGTVTEVDGFKIIPVDPSSGSIGFFGMIKENDVNSFLTARLKIDDYGITEIEVWVMREEFADERGGTLTLAAPRIKGLYSRDSFNHSAPDFMQKIKSQNPLDKQTLLSIARGEDRNIREYHTLVCDVDYGLVMELTISDYPNPNTGPVDPAYSGPYSIVESHLKKIEGNRIIRSISLHKPVTYRMGRNW